MENSLPLREKNISCTGNKTDIFLHLTGRFRCTGSSFCGLSCCEGWDIAVEEEDRARISLLDPDYASRITDTAPYRTRTTGQARVCAFLKENGRCRIYAAHGREALPHLCMTYPMGTAVFDGITEVFPDPGCPEIALALMDECPRDLVLLNDPPEGVFLTPLRGVRHFLLGVLHTYPGRFFPIKLRIVFGVICDLRSLYAEERFDEKTVEEVLAFYDGLGQIPEEALLKEMYRDPARHTAMVFRRLYHLFGEIDNGRFFTDLMEEEALARRAKELIDTPGRLIEAVRSFNDAYPLPHFAEHFFTLALGRDLLTSVPERLGDRFIAMTLIYSLSRFRMVLSHDGGRSLSERDIAVHLARLARRIYHRPYTMRLMTELMRAPGCATPEEMMRILA